MRHLLVPDLDCDSIVHESSMSATYVCVMPADNDLEGLMEEPQIDAASSSSSSKTGNGSSSTIVVNAGFSRIGERDPGLVGSEVRGRRTSGRPRKALAATVEFPNHYCSLGPNSAPGSAKGSSKFMISITDIIDITVCINEIKLSHLYELGESSGVTASNGKGVQSTFSNRTGSRTRRLRHLALGGKTVLPILTPMAMPNRHCTPSITSGNLSPPEAV
ncbi:hypothetical protein EDD37DRAFT_84830 [Exophiala viscosa]|uniref:Uncharacterized protein n=1 Tax=Exophiala viscosa TaxID=2486360 RepID=A0AAN6E173_9EURO|nr:hypothetical protein EDD36DRAFT_131344 [Exophiala viscosa]KAI1630171.1 hypothetical protein EDD37DRAFT_84830 [Exophiala viscosa]